MIPVPSMIPNAIPFWFIFSSDWIAKFIYSKCITTFGVSKVSIRNKRLHSIISSYNRSNAHKRDLLLKHEKFWWKNTDCCSVICKRSPLQPWKTLGFTILDHLILEFKALNPFIPDNKTEKKDMPPEAIILFIFWSRTQNIKICRKQSVNKTLDLACWKVLRM